MNTLDGDAGHSLRASLGPDHQFAPGLARSSLDPHSPDRILTHQEVGTSDFTVWVRPHLGYMRMLAVRMASAAVADDIVQEALELAWRKHGQFDETRGTARAWLLALTADRARKLRRRRHEVPLAPDELHSIADSPAAPDLDLQRAIGCLSPRQRLAVELFYFLGLGVDEVAQAMSCAPGTVKSTLSDARSKLRGHLGEDR